MGALFFLMIFLETTFYLLFVCVCVDALVLTPTFLSTLGLWTL